MQTPNYVGGGSFGGGRGLLGTLLGGGTPIYGGEGQPPSSGGIGFGLFAATPVYRQPPAPTAEEPEAQPVVVQPIELEGSAGDEGPAAPPMTIVIRCACETEKQS